MATSTLLWLLLAMALMRIIMADASRWKTLVGLVTKIFVENNMQAYMIAGLLLGFSYLALAGLETLLNFFFWLKDQDR
jgi:hypothetical protein